MYKFYNPNPLNKSIGDCVVRALSKALNKTWDDVYIDLILYGFKLKDMPSSNVVWGSYLKSKGFKKYLIPDICDDCYTISDFAKNCPTGTFIVCTGTHVVTIIDGVIYDSWDSGNETPIFYYQKGE